jgi:hypothetical protein
MEQEGRIITLDKNPGKLVDIHGRELTTEVAKRAPEQVVTQKPAEQLKEKVVTHLRDLKPNTLFRMHKSGTIYMKMPDGSIRNVDKAARKLARLKRKNQNKDNK